MTDYTTKSIDELRFAYCAAYYSLTDTVSDIENELHRRGLTVQELIESGTIAGEKRKLANRVHSIEQDIESAIPASVLRPTIRLAMRCVVGFSRALTWTTKAMRKASKVLDDSVRK